MMGSVTYPLFVLGLFWWTCIWWYASVFCKSSALALKGICEVLRVYSEVRVQRLCCLSMEITNSMLFPGFMVCGHTLFYVVNWLIVGGFFSKRLSLASEGIVKFMYCVSCLSSKIANSMVSRFHGMPTYIVLYTALMLVPHSYNGRWVFLRGVYFLHLKGVCEALRVYFEPRDSFKSLQKVSFVFPQNLQRQCCSQVSCMWKHIVLYMHCHWCWYHILYMWQLHESDEVEEDPVSTSPVLKAPSAPSPQQKGQLKNRIVFGLLIGFGCLGIVLAGGWVFTTAVAAAVWVATGEYFDLVQSKAMTRGMEAPPPVATKICSAVCAAMPLMTL